MTTPVRTQLVARENILKLLSDEEIVKASTAQSTSGLADRREYLDLENLDQSIQWVSGLSIVKMDRITSRNVVEPETWSEDFLAPCSIGSQFL